MTNIAGFTGGLGLPGWVPDGVLHYLAHTETGLPIRVLARRAQVHASTVLRQVRRYEQRRDDPLVDAALRALSHCLPHIAQGQERSIMAKSHPRHEAEDSPPPDEARIAEEGTRVLRRLAETGAMLAVARDMELGVILREDATGAAHRTGVVARDIAQAIALKDWIACADPEARVMRYRITAAGRTALKDLLAAAENRAQGLGGFAEAQAGFGMKPDNRGAPVAADPLLHQMRGGMAESPLAGLARRRDRDGKPFLARDLVATGERLREDFELSQMGTRVTQDWDRFLTGTTGTPVRRGGGRSGSSAAARDRVAQALDDLGPGLADVALRTCCHLEGMEQLEQRMGWSARSGKIVLRIALQRLQRHYEDVQGPYAPKIG